MQEKLNQMLINDSEKVGNRVLFIYCCAIAVAGCGAVMLFLNGGLRECVFLLGGVAAIITKLFEKQMGSAAKYVYICIPPIIGAITCAVCSTGTSDSYVCITHYYMAATALSVLYLDLKLIKVSAIVTVVTNLVMMLIFPAGFLKLHKGIGWLFILLFYLILFAGCLLICYRTTFLFGVVEDKGKEVEDVLQKVQSLSKELYSAGYALTSISESESASAQELAATSEQLAESSNVLSARTDESMANLGELSEWERVVADKVEEVETTSKNLLDKSMENEKLLNSLHAINGEVSDSMKATTDIAKKLSDAVQEIGVTLKLISDISASTNLLALNASIEAARAGEAGRGFSVVATEVGKLANDTQESLRVVEGVIQRVQDSVSEITAQVDENSSKLGMQNEYFANVFESIRVMTELLDNAVTVINTMGEAHGKQAEVIKKTVSINQDIAQSIKNENEQFSTINAMAENNANNTLEVASQAGAINGMVDEIGTLLKREQ